MPLPKPRKDESQDQFISRCMGDDIMKDEYPEQKQRSAVCYSQWRNKQNSATIAHLHHNMSQLVREETMDGREYLVAPTVMIVEGVLGDVYYSDEEIAQYPDHWNGRPVLVNHSVDKQGNPKTGNDPEEREKRTVGWLFNVRYENKRLKAEVWIDKEKCNHVEGGPDVLSKLENNQPIEVSTGVFTVDIGKKGIYNGEHYNSMATDLRGDHLALLPNGVGACSWDDGAGLPRLNREKNMNKNKLEKFMANVGKFINLSDNEKGIQTIFRELMDQLEEKYESRPEEKIVLIEDIYPESKSIIFEIVENGESRYFRQEYQNNNDMVILVNEPEEVERKTEFVAKQQQKENNKMDRKAVIDYLIENSDDFAEESRKELEELSDSILDKFKSNVEALAKAGGEGGSNQENSENNEPENPENNEPENPENNDKDEDKEDPKVHFNSVEDFLEAIPDGEVKDSLVESVTIRNNEKSNLVARLLNNENCDYSKEELEDKPLTELKRIGKLARVPNFAGNAGGPVSTRKRKGAVAMPSINWEDKGKIEKPEED